jgi:hypothetical protein
LPSHLLLQFHPLDMLEALGIAKPDIKKAKEAGFHTVESLLMNTSKVVADRLAPISFFPTAPHYVGLFCPKHCHHCYVHPTFRPTLSLTLQVTLPGWQVLAEIKGLSDAKIAKMREAAMKLVDCYGFKTATEIEARRERDIGG